MTVPRWLGRGRGVAVVVYSRAGCGLCRQAEELVRREAGAATVSIVDIDTDPDLQRRYDVLVPVVTVDGHEVAQLQLQPGQVRRAVAEAVRAGRHEEPGD